MARCLTILAVIIAIAAPIHSQTVTLTCGTCGGGGGGDVSTDATSSVDGELAIFDGTTGKKIKRATGSGVVLSTSGVMSVTAALGLAQGGTGGTSADTARASLGLVIGTNVQAWDADLDALAAGTFPAVIDSDTTGNAATASASDHSITPCPGGQFVTGISTTWSLTCGTSTADVGDIGYGDALTVFGDSITDGAGATAEANAWPNLVATERGWTLTNFGTAADVTIDAGTMDAILAQVVATDSIYATLFGYNDMTIPSMIDTYEHALRSALVWLATPDTQKIRGQSSAATKSGTWSNMTEYGGAMGVSSSSGAATVTATVTGSVVYVGYMRTTAAAGTFTVAIDGTVVGTLSSTGNVSSVKGRTYGPAVGRFAAVGSGRHTVVITPSGNGTIYLLWISSNESVASQTGPMVWAGNVLHHASENNTNRALTSSFSERTATVVSQLISDNLHVGLVRAGDYWDPNDPAQLAVDGNHPTDAGHAQIAKAFLNGMYPLAYPERNRPVTLEDFSLFARKDQANTFTSLQTFNNNTAAISITGNGGTFTFQPQSGVLRFLNATQTAWSSMSFGTMYANKVGVTAALDPAQATAYFEGGPVTNSARLTNGSGADGDLYLRSFIARPLVTPSANTKMFDVRDASTGTSNASVDYEGDAEFESVRLGSSGGPAWTFGSGAPGGACVNGSVYSRTDAGASDPPVYACRNTAWVALDVAP